MSTKHTPGPWYYDGTSGIVTAGKSSGCPYICDVRFSQEVAARGDIHADARLIAAAPDLLEACKRAVECLAHLDDGQAYDIVGALHEVEEAIAKASGESVKGKAT